MRAEKSTVHPACSRIRAHARIVASLTLYACLALIANAQTGSPAAKTPSKDTTMTLRATGPFDPKITPLPGDDATGTAGGNISRYALDKQYHGDLEGASKGEMLGGGDPAKGNAGYVAMERFTGTLRGRSGAFALQHSGTMDHGKLQLTVTVVPGSGAGELAGIAGTMSIIITNGKHSYDFEYTLPAKSE
ncbi:MAG: DUF3224 domain-containing protein [Terriglobales bacterium]